MTWVGELHRYPQNSIPFKGQHFSLIVFLYHLNLINYYFLLLLLFFFYKLPLQDVGFCPNVYHLMLARWPLQLKHCCYLSVGRRNEEKGGKGDV